MKLWRVAMAAAISVAFVPPAQASTATRVVTIPDRSFSPERVSIFIGDTVRWENTSSERHSVTASTDSRSRGESFDSSPSCDNGLLFSRCMRPGDSYSHTFTTRGTFTYYCRRHGTDAAYPDCGMCARVTVVRKQSSTVQPTTLGTATPTTSVSPSVSPSASPSQTAGSTSVGPGLAAPGGAGTSSTNAIAIAALGVVLLGASGYFVYRTMIRR